MLYKFKSKATGDLIMLEPNGRRMLEIIGKAVATQQAPQGIVLPEEMPAAQAALAAAIVHEEAARAQAVADALARHEAAPRFEAVSLRQRAQPFLDMLRRSEKEKHPIVWGV
jgi:hypothetical protein